MWRTPLDSAPRFLILPRKIKQVYYFFGSRKAPERTALFISRRKNTENALRKRR
jgi:hypothetical protein